MDVILHNRDIKMCINDYMTAGSITEAVNEFSGFSFTVNASSCPSDIFKPFISHIEVCDGKKQFFYGRVLNKIPSMDTTGVCLTSIVCESCMAYLCDSIQSYKEPMLYEGDNERTGLQKFIDLLLENHNNQLEDYKRIYRGTVNVKTWETNENVYKGLNYESTWEAIKTKLLDVFGGELQIRETDGKLYLDYAENLGQTRATKIQVGVNMQSAERTFDPSKVVSRLIPLGAKLIKEVIDEEGNTTEQETDERLTIADVNDGVIYLESETAKDLFTIQYKPVIWDDIHDPQILKTRGIQYLSQQNTALATSNVTAVDLSFLGISADSINLFDQYHVYNPHVDFDEELEVVKKTTDIFNPATPSFTLGNKDIFLTDISSGTAGKVENIKNTVDSIKTDTVNKVNGIYSFVTETATQIQQNTNNIIAQVAENTISKSEYESFSETVRNILKMDADGTSMIFQTIIEEIQRVDGEQQSNYSEILKYIRFEDGNIILGIQGNPIVLTLENDKISFKQNGMVVAFFANNRFMVVDGEFQNSLRIGKFAFIPRENGNLSFMKVGE